MTSDTSPEPRLRPGLCSVALRGCSPAEVIEAAAGAGLAGIEWGADVHVPPGELATAADVAARCGNAGIAVVSYGSYLCAGRDDGFDQVFDTARAVGALNVRVWAGDRASSHADVPHREAVATALRHWCALAAVDGLTVSLEHHAGTLTDDAASSLALLDEVDAPNLRTYWQPRDGDAGEPDLGELDAVRPHLAHVHVFWWRSWADRFPLAAGEAFWRRALARAAAAPSPISGGRYALIEFVKDDDPEQLAADAAALRSWLP